MNDQWLTIPEFSRKRKISRSSTYRLLRRGKLRAVKVGRSTRILPEDDEAFSRNLSEFKSGAA